MSQLRANCPNCGAAVEFRWSGAVQTTCDYCHSILVRRDLDLTKVGQVAELPRDVSPIQIGTEGVYRNKAFVAVGRILYEYEDGGWNEWHIVFQDGTSGWLSDAQLEYTISFASSVPEPMPAAAQLQRGRKLNWNKTTYDVTSITRARYRGVEGELPFEYWDKSDAAFVDLRTADARFGTIDYSQEPPVLFLGEAVEFDDLRLKNLRQFDTQPGGAGAAVSGLNCPGCGAALAIHAAGYSLSVVCPKCRTVLDAKDPNLQILEKFQASQSVEPLIPLGSHGNLFRAEYQVVGFQVRTTDVEDIPDSWSEYLLFNPYKGFRYLTEYNGHWNFVKTVPASPEHLRIGKKSAVQLMGHKYMVFASALATTTYVLGEFPWRVHVGEKNGTTDYISPPRILSNEITEGEAVWSLGEYMTGAQIWQGFKLPAKAPPARGIFANQPAPFAGRASSMWRASMNLFSVLIVLAVLIYMFAGQETLFKHLYSYSPRAGAEASFVTDTFEVKGHPSNVEVSISTDLENNWAYFNLALINESTGQGYDFGREMSYYHGRDSDGAWTEGGRNDSAIVPSVVPGRYYLRVEPEMAKNAQSMLYTLEIKRSVPSMAFLWIGAALLVLPPISATWRAAAFEAKRWAESDLTES